MTELREESGAGWRVVLGDGINADGSVGALADVDGVDVYLADPPYSRHVHKSVRSNKRNEAPDVAEFECRARRVVDLGFEHLSPRVRRGVARWCADNVKRWCAVFCDVESTWLWRLSFQAVGLDYVKTAEWERLGGAPQMTGDRPSQSNESIVLAHPKGRKRWNGGGKAGRYSFPIVANRLGERGSRVHPAQKPVDLMVALIDDFTEPGELVCDSFAGSGSTGVAAIRRGRRFVGCERDESHFETAVRRLREEEARLALTDERPGQPRKQTTIFDRIGGTK